MRKLLTLGVVLALGACGGTELAGLDTSSSDLNPRAVAHIPVCPGPAALGEARCHARVVVDASGAPKAASTPSGYGPADIQSAYGLSASSGGGRTIAIVDAGDDPNAEKDLGVYRSQYGLPPCTTANGCFKKVDQNGGTKYPRKDAGWSLEISLDLDMASAACPSCKILLVEASSASMANLGTAVNTAVALGANAVSNSYGGGEYSGETSDENAYFNHPGVAITVSSGDSGYGVEFPAASRYVTAVGGTSLKRSGGGFSETAWSGAGSGCSKYEPKPSWQSDPGCPNRTVADVSAVADPATGVAVYDSVRYQGRSGWMTVGGTSASAPIVGAIYAAAGGSSASTAYAHTSSLHDVTSGSNGSCGGSYLCTSTAGYDGPTGLGTPSGYTAF